MWDSTYISLNTPYIKDKYMNIIISSKTWVFYLLTQHVSCHSVTKISSKGKIFTRQVITKLNNNIIPVFPEGLG